LKRKNAVKRRHAITLAVCCAALFGCGQDGLAAFDQQEPKDDIPEILALIGNEKITLADVRARNQSELDQLELQYQRVKHRIVENALNEILRERVLLAEARKQGRTLDQLLEAEAGRSLEPNDVEVAGWFSENKERVGGRTLEQVRSQVAAYLREEHRKSATEKLEQRLYKQRQVSINLEPFRVVLNNSAAPVLGRRDAAVTLVEFADFQCPFCGQFHSTLARLEKQFGDKLAVVYRQFPLTQIHPFAFKAAEASLCANEQAKFWQLHDLMYQEQAKLTVSDLKDKARRIGVDQKRFDSCLDSGKYVEQVQNDFKEGSRVGVTGTPALFVNGIAVEGGAVAYEKVAEAIQKELDRRRN